MEGGEQPRHRAEQKSGEVGWGLLDHVGGELCRDRIEEPHRVAGAAGREKPGRTLALDLDGQRVAVDQRFDDALAGRVAEVQGHGLAIDGNALAIDRDLEILPVDTRGPVRGRVERLTKLRSGEHTAALTSLI